MSSKGSSGLLKILCNTLLHPSLEGRYTPWVSAQESRQPPVLFVTNANKMALAFMDLYGRFLRNRVWFVLFSVAV